MMKRLWAIGISVMLATSILLCSPKPSFALEPAIDEEAVRIKSEILKLKEDPKMQIAAWDIDRELISKPFYISPS